MLDLTALRSLCSVAEHGTLAQAAAELGYTPSAISQQIARLERQVDAPLLAPAGRGVVLTPVAAHLVANAPAVFSALERCETGARKLREADPSGTIRVAAFSTAIRGLLSSAVAQLAGLHPQIHVHTRELDSAPAIRAVEIGESDLALIHDADGIQPAIPTRLTTRPLHVDVGDLIVRRDHPLCARTEALDRSDLAGLTWVTSPPGTVCHLWFQRLVGGLAEEPDVHHTIDDFSTQIALVQADRVAALIPRLARPALPDSLRALPLTDPPRRTVLAVWRESGSDDPALGALLATLSEPQSRA